MKRLFALGLAVLLMVGLLTGCGSSESDDTTAASTASTGIGVSVTAPEGWTQAENQDSSGQYLKYKDGQGSSFIISYAELSDSSKTLDEYVESSKKEIRDGIKDVKFGKTTKLKLGGLDAVQLDYSTTINGIGATMSQSYVIKGNRFFVFSATAASDNFEKVKGDIKAFQDSVKF